MNLNGVASDKQHVTVLFRDSNLIPRFSIGARMSVVMGDVRSRNTLLSGGDVQNSKRSV